MKHWTFTNIAWFVAYLGVLAVIVVGLRGYRAGAIERYGTGEANAKWQDWREAAERISDEGPVTRTPPKSSEPPALVLMRDHYPACLGISLLLSSCLFGWFMVCVRGAMRPAEINYTNDE